MFSRFAAEEPHTVITPSHLFEIGGLAVTNSMIYGWICAVFIIFILVKARKKLRIGGAKTFAEVIEVGTDFILNMVQDSVGSRAKALKYAPIFATLFFFVLLNNWLGLLPGVGEAVTYNDNPLLRAFTADLNGTLAMALFGMTVVQIIAITESGFARHIKHYFPGSFINPLTYLIGAFEIFTELTRLVSLGLRLFLNIAIGEILIGVAAYLGSGLAPLTALPFTLLEIFVGVLQAYIFVVLCTAYLSATIAHEDGHAEESAA